MGIELVPVIEIGYNNQGLPVPPKGPYWEHAELWDMYNAASYQKAGFRDDLPPYLPGSSFYRLTDITDNNLVKLVKGQTEEMGNNNNSRDFVSPFSGGYVLRIDGLDMYFPQCCGDLSDIRYWENLLTGSGPFFYSGHPEPKVEVTDSEVIFDFSVGDDNEGFSPPPARQLLAISKTALEAAIENVNIELARFAGRLDKINIDDGLKIDGLGKLLIWWDN